ncbi:TPA: hypothetical protein NIB55_006109 [Pseudomonas aeruginosa]|nr:hypothetical protein [Pseudomonas aeruginosa]
MALINQNNPLVVTLRRGIKTLVVVSFLAVAGVSTYKSFTREPVLTLPYVKLTGEAGPKLAYWRVLEHFD